MSEADVGRGTLEGKLCRVLQDQDRAIGRLNAQRRGCEMAREDLALAGILIVKEAVSGLRVGPILKCRRQRFPRTLAHRRQHRSQQPVQSRILQIAFSGFFVHPAPSHACTPFVEGAGERITPDL
jgi:hypothetical protein